MGSEMTIDGEEVAEDETTIEEVEEVVEEVADQPDETIEEESTESEDESIEITVGEESLTSEDEAEEKAPAWVKEVRKANRELARENKELKAKQEASTIKDRDEPLGPKPTLESCDYDEAKYEAALPAYFDRKRKAEQKTLDQEEQVKAQQRDWNTKLEGYETAKKALKVQDYDDAEQVVLSSLNETQQSIIVSGAENPAIVTYAIGKNSKRAEELSKIKDPVKFAFAVAKLETQIKTGTKKATPPPERSVRKGTGSGAVDSTLKKLEAEAERTNDMSKVFAYEKKLRAKSK